MRFTNENLKTSHLNALSVASILLLTGVILILTGCSLNSTLDETMADFQEQGGETLVEQEVDYTRSSAKQVSEVHSTTKKERTTTISKELVPTSDSKTSLADLTKECARLCTENMRIQGVDSPYIKDECESSCSQAGYYGGTSTIQEMIKDLKESRPTYKLPPIQEQPRSLKQLEKECTDTCTRAVELESGSDAPAIRDECESACAQLAYYGGSSALVDTIRTYQSSIASYKALTNNDVTLCYSNPTVTDRCITKFIDENEDFEDTSVCNRVEDKEKCLRMINFRIARKHNDPTLCKPTAEFSGCYKEYLENDMSCERDKSGVALSVCALELLQVSREDYSVEAVKRLREDLKRGSGGYIYFGDLAMTEAVFKKDFQLCDNLCSKDPSGFTRRSDDCDRSNCLSKIVLLNSDVDYFSCNSYYLRNPTYGEKAGLIGCLMSQAMRDNDEALCDELKDVSEGFVSICKDNVQNWNK